MARRNSRLSSIPVMGSRSFMQSLNAKSADGEVREFKPGETLWCDLEQSGDLFKFEVDGHFEWFVNRETFG